MSFPINPFDDVQPSDFNKLNKKNVTEDFVEENFKFLKWDVFVPFHDTGIDRIVVKSVCPNNHTKPDQNLRFLNNKCPICKSTGVEIMRFIQVKTRQLKNNIFGFTIKSKDLRIDPRHIFLLYSDQTTNQKQDFLVISNKELLSFFYKNQLSPFSSTSFRKGNNKLNSLKYNSEEDKWGWGKFSWEGFRNLKGMLQIQDPKIDLNLEQEIIETKFLADKLLKKITSFEGNEYAINKLNNVLLNNIKVFKNGKKIVSLRQNIKNYIHSNCEKQTYLSMEKYFEGIILNLNETNNNEY